MGFDLKEGSGLFATKGRWSLGRQCSLAKKSLQIKAQDFASEQETKSAYVKVVEYFMLLEVRPDLQQEDVLKMLGSMWSLQYMIPQVLCASAGSILVVNNRSQGGLFNEHSDKGAGFTHALHFRFGNPEVADAFRQHPTFTKTKKQGVDVMCDRVAELVAVVEVPNDLGAIFRRGGDWEEGVEHIIVMKAQNGVKKEGVNKYVSHLQELAETSVGGALCSSVGPLAQITDTFASSSSKDHSSVSFLALVTQFPTFEGCQAFDQISMVQQIQKGDSNQALQAIFSICFEIAPAEGQQRSAGGRSP